MIHDDLARRQINADRHASSTKAQFAMSAVLRALIGNAADTFKIVSSYVIGTVALGFCIYTAWYQGALPHLQVMVCILGGVLGWILGLYVTPSNETEKKNFSEYGKTLAALASGFGLAKIESIAKWINNAYPDTDVELAVLRLLIFTCTLLIAALFTYISRLHVRGDEDALRSKREKVYVEIGEAIERLKKIN